MCSRLYTSIHTSIEGCAPLVLWCCLLRLDVLDDKHGVIRVRVDSEDDLWFLSLFISSGDLVKALTTRDVSIGDEKRRLPMVLTVKVLKLEFQPFTNKLRIHGIVVEGPDRFGVLGSHHTVSVGVGSEVVIFKNVWDRRTVEDMLKFLKPMNLLLVSVDFDEYSIALLQLQGLRIVDEKNVSLPVSDEGFEKAVEDLVDELARRIVETARRYRVEAVVIGSPGDLKNRIKKAIESLDRELRIYTDSVANGGYAGLQELLHRDTVRSIVKDTAIAKASEILEYFDMLMAKDIGRVAYGIDHVEIAAEVGAIEKLLIIDELLSGFSEIREKIDKILRNVVEKNGNIVIVPSKSPPGERVKMLGGVIAILRYALDTEWLKNSKDYN